MHRCWFSCASWGAVVGLVGMANVGWGQIGGKTAADGVFLLEDVEDLDLQAIGVDRPWIPQYVFNGGLSAHWMEGTELTLVSGQSPVGALLYEIPSEFGFINKSYGVPMPSEPGQSTLDFPGNIVEFEEFQFLIAFTPRVQAQEFWVIMETYPQVRENVYPRIMWRYHPTEGMTFQRVRIPIHEPTLILDGEGFTLEELLSQTRFMSFYFYGETPQFPIVQFKAYIDDIEIVPGNIEPGGPSDIWMITGPGSVDDVVQEAVQDGEDQDDIRSEGDSPAR